MPIALSRRLIAAAATTSALIALNVAGAVLPAQADSRDHGSARISVSASHVKAGQHVRISGVVTAHGHALADAVVTVQKRVHGKTRWTTLAAARTDTSGRLTMQSFDLKRSHDFRIAYAGDTETAPVTSTPVTVSAQQKVAITSVSDLHPTAGDIVTIGGSAYPGIADRRAYLQLQTDSGWRSVASTRVPTDGGFTVTVRSMRGGEQQYRFLVVGDEGVLPATSDPETFEVYAWYRLADETPLASTSFAAGPQSIGETVYEDALAVALTSRQAAYTEYQLDYSCRLLRTTMGPTDDSGDDFSARFTAKVDDARPIDMVLAKGSTWSETAEISGGKTLRLTSFAVAGSGTAGWGDAEVLCVGQP